MNTAGCVWTVPLPEAAPGAAEREGTGSFLGAMATASDQEEQDSFPSQGATDSPQAWVEQGQEQVARVPLEVAQSLQG